MSNEPNAKPSDRPEQQHDTARCDELPQVFLIVSGKRFPRPGLETYFAEVEEGDNGDDPVAVAEVYCSCNKVRTCSCVPVCSCQAVCSCVGHRSCGCDSHRSCSCVGHRSGGGVITGCRCAPVH